MVGHNIELRFLKESNRGVSGDNLREHVLALVNVAEAANVPRENRKASSIHG